MLGLFLVGTALLALLGAAQYFGWIGKQSTTSTADTGATEQVYTCPMHPWIRQPAPGRCPICAMELVPATSSSANLDELAVTIDPAARRLANIQTATVERKSVSYVIETVGSLAIDESRMATIAAYVDGRIERLFADYTGVEVAEDDHLAVIYSPELHAAQVEHVESLRALKEMSAGVLPVVRETQEKMAANSRQKLSELGMTEAQIEELEKSDQPKSRLTIYAPIGGTVIEKMAVEGQYVTAGEPVYRIANLTTIWLMLELYPEDAARIRYGQYVEAEVQSLKEELFHGRVAFVDPVVDPKTRTVGVRVELLNTERRLRPGDYASAEIQVPIGETGDVYDADLSGKWISPMHPQIIAEEPGECPICGMDLVPTSRYGYSEKPVERPTALVVPRDAVLMAGHNSVVYVETEPGRFEIRPVVLGPIMRDTAVVLHGLGVGEQVATSGNFLIDSQMQLAGKPSLIDPTRAKDRPAKPGPFSPEHIHVEPMAGEAGQQLEQLYRAYLAVQQALSADNVPRAEDVRGLQAAAKQLSQESGLDSKLQELVEEVVAESSELRGADLETARKQFKPLSQSVIRLAVAVRGDDAQQPFMHFYCPMVKGGGGDWLQADDSLANPYFGSKMLRCGELVHRLPISGHLDAGDKEPVLR